MSRRLLISTLALSFLAAPVAHASDLPAVVDTPTVDATEGDGADDTWRAGSVPLVVWNAGVTAAAGALGVGLGAAVLATGGVLLGSYELVVSPIAQGGALALLAAGALLPAAVSSWALSGSLLRGAVASGYVALLAPGAGGVMAGVGSLLGAGGGILVGQAAGPRGNLFPLLGMFAGIGVGAGVGVLGGLLDAGALAAITPLPDVGRTHDPLVGDVE